MKARIDAGTDAALIAAWDASRGAYPLAESDDPRDALELDAAAGHVFGLELGGDGGGPVDVYVDESIPDAELAALRPIAGTYLLAVPTGALVVGGGEDYRSSEPINTSDRSVVRIPPGEYAVRSFASADPEREAPSEEALRALVGPGELEWYDSRNRAGCVIGALLLLLFPLLLIPFSWMVALPVTIVAFVGWFPLRERLLKRSSRYQRLHAVIPAFRLRTAPAWLVFELRRVTERGELRGGIASL